MHNDIDLLGAIVTSLSNHALYVAYCIPIMLWRQNKNLTWFQTVLTSLTQWVAQRSYWLGIWHRGHSQCRSTSFLHKYRRFFFPIKEEFLTFIRWSIQKQWSKVQIFIPNCCFLLGLGGAPGEGQVNAAVGWEQRLPGVLHPGSTPEFLLAIHPMPKLKWLDSHNALLKQIKPRTPHCVYDVTWNSFLRNYITISYIFSLEQQLDFKIPGWLFLSQNHVTLRRLNWEPHPMILSKELY